MRGSRRDQTSRTRRRALAVCAPLALAVALAAVTAATAGAAAPTWGQASELALPNDASSSTPAASAAWVACPASGDCAAVGSYTDSLGDHDALVMSESGGAWGQGAPITLPSGADPSMAGASGVTTSLESVSCAAPGDCAAVGRYVDGSGDTNAMVASESGGAWGPASEMAAPSGADSNPKASLASVSCTGVGTCVAVGSYSHNGNPEAMVVSESGGVWGAASEIPPPSFGASLQSVSCTGAGSCVAVGSNDDGSVSGSMLFVTETGGVWHTPGTIAAPSVAEDASADADSVWCTDVNDCVAVGSYPDATGTDQPLVASESAGAWAQATPVTPLPANAGTSSGSGGGHPEALLASVWCTDVSDCVAVGSFEDDALNGHQLAVTESGGSWGAATELTGVPSNTEMPPDSSLSAVACPASGLCLAVGQYNLDVTNAPNAQLPMVVSENVQSSLSQTSTTTSASSSAAPTATTAITTATTSTTATPTTNTVSHLAVAAGARASLAATTVNIKADGKATFRISCRGAAACIGTLRLAITTKRKGKRKATTKVIATAAFSITPGTTAPIKLALDAVGRALLSAGHGRLNATLTIVKASPAPAQTSVDHIHLDDTKPRR